MSAFLNGKIMVSCFLLYVKGTPFITINGDVPIRFFSNTLLTDSETKYLFSFVSFKTKVCGLEHPKSIADESINKMGFINDFMI